MKIQCNACEAAEASVLCCADEAALCLSCDETVHAANKLASKHQRVPLNAASSQMPKCDICQETAGFFFCLEDRALLCRKCDMAIHTANEYVSGHQRFLLTGVTVGLEGNEAGPSSSSGNSRMIQNVTGRKSFPPSRKSSQPPLTTTRSSAAPAMSTDRVPRASENRSISGGSATINISQWQMDDFLGFSDFSQGYFYPDDGSSKADSGKLGDSDNSAMLRSSGEDEGVECVGGQHDSSWAVPEMPSPPTASGLFWPRKFESQRERNAFVPDVCSSELHNHGGNPHRGRGNGNGRKRRRC